MKNMYFGDVGDFGKYGLLSMVMQTGLKVGVNWYLTEDDNSTDGKFIDYFGNTDFTSCDGELNAFLHRCILENRRYVMELRKLNRFNSTPVFEDVLKTDDIKALSEVGRLLRKARREEWFIKSLDTLSDCEIIFCDPDNGIEPKSLSKTGKDSVKYVYTSEIEQMVNDGRSVIVYNHRNRSNEADYKARFIDVHRSMDGKTHLRIIRFNRYSVRDYLFFIQDKHKAILNRQIDALLMNYNWCKLFAEVII